MSDRPLPSLQQSINRDYLGALPSTQPRPLPKSHSSPSPDALPLDPGQWKEISAAADRLNARIAGLNATEKPAYANGDGYLGIPYAMPPNTSSLLFGMPVPVGANYPDVSVDCYAP